MIGKSKTQRIYKAVRNYLYNELKINKSYVDDLITKRVNERVDYIIEHKFENIENILCNRITQILLSDNIKHDIYYDRQSLTKFIQQEIKRVVHQLIDSKISINVELKKKINGPLA